MIVSIGDQSFALTPNKKNSQPREIAYAQLTAVHKDKLSRGQKIAATVIVVSAGIAVVAVIATIHFDHSFQKLSF
jgi:hypothetical protein